MEKTKVTLAHGSKEQEFDVQHAEELLNYQTKKGFTDWKLPEGSGFKYENGAISPTGKGSDKDSGKQPSSGGSSKP